MKKLVLFALIIGLVSAAQAQRRPVAKPAKTVIFAVLNDGTMQSVDICLAK